MTYPELLTVRELAAELRVGRNTAYELVHSGQIRSVWVGGQIRITRAALDAFLQDDDRHDSNGAR